MEGSSHYQEVGIPCQGDIEALPSVLAYNDHNTLHNAPCVPYLGEACISALLKETLQGSTIADFLEEEAEEENNIHLQLVKQVGCLQKACSWMIDVDLDLTTSQLRSQLSFPFYVG